MSDAIVELSQTAMIYGEYEYHDSFEVYVTLGTIRDAVKRLAAQPPCGADGAELAALVIQDLCESEPENPDDPDTLCVKVDYVREVIRQHASQPAAPVAPATVVPEADPFGVDADLCGELHELDTDIGYRAASRIGQLAMLAASKREGGGT